MSEKKKLSISAFFPAYNDAVRAMGREHGVRALTWQQRLAAFLA